MWRSARPAGSNSMIPRLALPTLHKLAHRYPAVATGPRQTGKTTLAKAAFPDKPHVNLEAPTSALATDDPKAFLAQYPDGAVLDEVQRALALFSWLQGRLDTDGRM